MRKGVFIPLGSTLGAAKDLRTPNRNQTTHHERNHDLLNRWAALKQMREAGVKKPELPVLDADYAPGYYARKEARDKARPYVQREKKARQADEKRLLAILSAEGSKLKPTRKGKFIPLPADLKKKLEANNVNAKTS